MSIQPLTAAKFRELDANGVPLSGGKLYTFAAGTTTPLATYADASGTVANANPVILDAAGRADVWLQPGLLYKFVLQNSSGVTQYTEDNFPAPPNPSASSNVVAIEPGGRLTLSTGTPVPITDDVSFSVIYYTAYRSTFVPLYDGTNWALWSFGNEISQAVSDVTKSPAAVVANSNYDLFVWNDTGVIRLSRGPAWSSDTARGTGIGTTELMQVNGRFVNKNAITNGPAAQLGLYVGTVRSDGGALINDSMAKRHCWNQYNRVRRPMRVLETNGFWTYETATWRQANGAGGNQLDYVCGLAEDEVEAVATGLVSSATASSLAQVGVGVDSTTAPSGLYAETEFGNPANYITALSAARYAGIPGLGRHYLAWLEWGSSGGTINFYGTSNGQTGIIGSTMA